VSAAAAPTRKRPRLLTCCAGRMARPSPRSPR
jgi:hypothetical protein